MSTFNSVLATEHTAISVNVSSNSTELGKPIFLTLETTQSIPSLEKIDLTELNENFEIQAYKDVETGPDNNHQSWRIRLYPRQQGLLIIPALKFNSQETKEINIKVTEPIDIKNNETIQIEFNVSDKQIWQGQQIVATYMITNQRPITVIKPANKKINSVTLLNIEKQHQQIYLNNTSVEQHTAGWVVIPNNTGNMVLNLPPLQYIRDGVVTHQFYPPLVPINIKPLPAYLPAAVPVGNISITSVNNPLILTSNTLHEKTITIHASGIEAKAIPNIQYQIKSNEQVQYYKARKDIKSYTTASGLQTTITYTIPYKPLKQGGYTEPNITLSYLNPNNNKYTTIHSEEKSSLILSSWLLNTIYIISFVILFKLFLNIISLGISKAKHFNGYRHVKQQLGQATTANEIRTLIQETANIEHWSKNISLAQWQKNIKIKFNRLQFISINDLNDALYYDKKINSDLLKKPIIQLLYYRWPILKWIN